MSKFNPETFLVLAGYLSLQEGEAHWRTAVSRSYYGLFLTARAIAGITSKKSDVHRHTQAYFQERGNTRIADLLRRLRRMRNAADYRLELTFERDMAINTVAIATLGQQLIKTPQGPRLCVVT
ncbi:hypothetical protein CDN99_08800 [Roseateles aquatilis]|uniref:HEPN domain-containing protein n=1 Tax=Roseateles aquatilis TaxID=431061 RepID=A0A246JF07_9BURK|nr:hypothetical protein [Roseateles aquatilis]OWQ91266.1 hypothetical protein CDN99_08800 [Roseateles aquatilis]